MDKNFSSPCDCGHHADNHHGAKPLEMLPVYRPPAPGQTAPEEASCCGWPAGPPSSVHEKPGYILCGFVQTFMATPAGPVPRIDPKLARRDHLGALKVRLGIGRNDYKVAPGLYALGAPDAEAPVLVTANYKLSFDHLRSRMAGANAWLLVLDTRGINVWCAAGKGTFGTQEVIRQVRLARLASVVNHRKLILPQLGAPGVSAHQVKKGCGFEVTWGPVRAVDLPIFLETGKINDPGMRRVTFTMGERMVLIPVELSLSRKVLAWALAAVFLLSGIGPHIFSFAMAWSRGLMAAMAVAAGVLAGCAVVPLLLPWIPGRAFAVKGALAGLALSLPLLGLLRDSPHLSLGSATALALFAIALSSFLAMDFTGATPFTSPTGVEKEMRRAIPLQLGATLLSAALWIGVAF